MILFYSKINSINIKSATLATNSSTRCPEKVGFTATITSSKSHFFGGHLVVKIQTTVQNLMNYLMRWNYASGPKYLKMLIYLC